MILRISLEIEQSKIPFESWIVRVLKTGFEFLLTVSIQLVLFRQVGKYVGCYRGTKCRGIEGEKIPFLLQEYLPKKKRKLN